MQSVDLESHGGVQSEWSRCSRRGQHLHAHLGCHQHPPKLIGLEAAASRGHEHFTPPGSRENLVNEQDWRWAREPPAG